MRRSKMPAAHGFGTLRDEAAPAGISHDHTLVLRECYGLLFFWDFFLFVFFVVVGRYALTRAVIMHGLSAPYSSLLHIACYAVHSVVGSRAAACAPSAHALIDTLELLWIDAHHAFFLRT
jgi:hypothetical protein